MEGQEVDIRVLLGLWEELRDQVVDPLTVAQKEMKTATIPLNLLGDLLLDGSSVPIGWNWWISSRVATGGAIIYAG
ncbi:hypothetical protein CYMTET_21405 [Cymbomonas tetramitiformis]|uniref:Uncharacterized protein n=1 Tax=Cymbomonas tetramitiformis TaxID=36881 RepID=A0AAE0G3E9_9CHLO|nr:hypothetical protein CYMTET_21405 [Cymbomonas tetramitiformis]